MKKSVVIFPLVVLLTLTSCGPKIGNYIDKDFPNKDNFSFMDPSKGEIDEIVFESPDFLSFTKRVYRESCMLPYRTTKYLYSDVNKDLQDSEGNILPGQEILTSKQDTYFFNDLYVTRSDERIVHESEKSKILSQRDINSYIHATYDKENNKFHYATISNASYQKHGKLDDKSLMSDIDRHIVAPYKFDINGNENLPNNIDDCGASFIDIRFNHIGFGFLANSFDYNDNWKSYQRDDTYMFTHESNITKNNETKYLKFQYTIVNFKLTEWAAIIETEKNGMKVNQFHLIKNDYSPKTPELIDDSSYGTLSGGFLEKNSIYKRLTR